jgi:hypothetical protein
MPNAIVRASATVLPKARSHPQFEEPTENDFIDDLSFLSDRYATAVAILAGAMVIAEAANVPKRTMTMARDKIIPARFERFPLLGRTPAAWTLQSCRQSRQARWREFLRRLHCRWSADQLRRNSRKDTEWPLRSEDTSTYRFFASCSPTPINHRAGSESN